MANVTLRGVRKAFGEVEIIKGVDFDVPPGRTTMLLGRNGAGKTTCLRTVMGLWRPSQGEIRLAGAVLSGRPASASQIPNQ